MAKKSKTQQAAKTIDPKRVFDQAQAFNYATKLLCDDTNRRLHNGAVLRTGVQLPVFVPMQVTSAFAVELYLKCLILLDGGTPAKSHNLFDLYNGLTAKTRQLAEQHHDRIKKIDPTQRGLQLVEQLLGRMKKIDPTQSGLQPQLSSLNLSGKLKLCGNAFDAFRYGFEGSKSIGGCLDSCVIFAVRDTILEIKPDWEPT